MHCLVCNAEMIKRSGKFGPFHSCKDHGTVSVQGSKLVATGQIHKALTLALTQSHTASHCTTGGVPDLEYYIRTKIAGDFGIIMDELDLFCEGGPETADDDPDHWMNLRPY